jgi:hypothetical protein
MIVIIIKIIQFGIVTIFVNYRNIMDNNRIKRIK